jgi:hypothetical protein
VLKVVVNPTRDKGNALTPRSFHAAFLDPFLASRCGRRDRGSRPAAGGARRTSGCGWPAARRRRPPADPNFGFTLLASPSAFSFYDAGTLTLRRDFARNFSILANYVYSKSIDLTTDVQLTGAPMNYLYPEFDRADGDNDIRHRFTAAFLAEAPPSWPVVLRNFKFSTLNTLQSPRHYTLFAGFDVNGDGFPFSDRVGTIGRNTYRGDATYTTDVRLQRSFALTERYKLEAGLEAFNVFNRPSVLDIDTVYGAATFLGPIPRRFGDGITSPANPTFGSARFVAPARQLQLSLRLDF